MPDPAQIRTTSEENTGPSSSPTPSGRPKAHPSPLLSDAEITRKDAPYIKFFHVYGSAVIGSLAFIASIILSDSAPKEFPLNALIGVPGFLLVKLFLPALFISFLIYQLEKRRVHPVIATTIAAILVYFYTSWHFSGSSLITEDMTLTDYHRVVITNPVMILPVSALLAYILIAIGLSWQQKHHGDN